MSPADFERARAFLRGFAGKVLSSIDCDEFHLDLLFEGGFRFQTHCSWRFIQGDSLIFGRGDVGGQVSTDEFTRIIGLKVVSTSISNCWDSYLCFEKDYVFQVISDTVQFETWEAHLEAGSVIFGDGDITVFPRTPTV
jgi:hypothetical protein